MSQDREAIIDQIFQDFKLIGRSFKKGHKPPADLGRPSPAQIEMIHIISGRGQISVKEIAETMQVSGSAVTQFADPLVDAGLIEREHDKDDRRIVNIKLSKAGRDKLTNIEGHGKRHMTEIFEPLTDDELETLRDLHHKIIDNIINKKEQVK
jgi:DNA-binding MarR family transcriptional regulator